MEQYNLCPLNVTNRFNVLQKANLNIYVIQTKPKKKQSITVNNVQIYRVIM